MAVSDSLHMFIEPTIARVPSGFSGWFDTKILLKKTGKIQQGINRRPTECH